VADLAVESIVKTGLEPTYNAAANGGDAFVNKGKEFVHIKNSGAASRTVTVVTQQTVETDLAVADRDIVVPAGEERIVGPFPQATYNDGDGKVQMTYSDETDLTIAVLKLG
jgi:hypothetical protein